MWSPSSKRTSVVAAVAVTSVLAVFAEAAAAEPLVFPAGQACDFGLAVDFAGAPQEERTFGDANRVRTHRSGFGQQLTFTNLSTNATITLPANGSVGTTVSNADGSSTITVTGHNVWIQFPTDVPAGPSTT